MQLLSTRKPLAELTEKDLERDMLVNRISAAIATLGMFVAVGYVLFAVLGAPQERVLVALLLFTALNLVASFAGLMSQATASLERRRELWEMAQQLKQSPRG